jgi:hypothetical protein
VFNADVRSRRFGEETRAQRLQAVMTSVLDDNEQNGEWRPACYTLGYRLPLEIRAYSRPLLIPLPGRAYSQESKKEGCRLTLAFRI